MASGVAMGPITFRTVSMSSFLISSRGGYTWPYPPRPLSRLTLERLANVDKLEVRKEIGAAARRLAKTAGTMIGSGWPSSWRQKSTGRREGPPPCGDGGKGTWEGGINTQGYGVGERG